MEEDRPSARATALRRLSLREHSEGELKAYLARKGYSENEIDESLSELRNQGFLDDRRFAAAFARAQSLRGKGAMHVMSALNRKGVRLPLAEVRKILSEVGDEPETEQVRKILEKRYPRAAEDPRERRRAFQALLRRGFSAEAIRSCISLYPESD